MATTIIRFSARDSRHTHAMLVSGSAVHVPVSNAGWKQSNRAGSIAEETFGSSLDQEKKKQKKTPTIRP